MQEVSRQISEVGKAFFFWRQESAHGKTQRYAFKIWVDHLSFHSQAVCCVTPVTEDTKELMKDQIISLS